MALFKDRFGNNNFGSASQLRQRDPTEKPSSNFLSLFENHNLNDIDLAYLDSVIFQPIASLNSQQNTNASQNSNHRDTNSNNHPRPPASAFPFNTMNDNNMSRYSFSNYPSRGTDLERERNGLSHMKHFFLVGFVALDYLNWKLNSFWITRNRRVYLPFINLFRIFTLLTIFF